MLLAKIKEKLFNRRNTVEVESLEGEITINGKPLSENFSSIYEVQNIKAISEEILSKLKAGDVVQKLDSSGKHSYIVSFKKDGTGICLTYADASVVETQSYDFTEGHWVYNSEDKSSIGGTSLKVGDYISNLETGKFEWVEEIPEDYTGPNIYIQDDEVGFYKYNNGEVIFSVSTADGLSVFEQGVSAELTPEGVTKLNFASLTHSFNELDETLQGIIEDAFDNAGVACSEAQWSAIKDLLDKSLYINIDGCSLIKSATDGFQSYAFGITASPSVYAGVVGLEIYYDTTSNLLYALKSEV